MNSNKSDNDKENLTNNSDRNIRNKSKLKPIDLKKVQNSVALNQNIRFKNKKNNAIVVLKSNKGFWNISEKIQTIQQYAQNNIFRVSALCFIALGCLIFAIFLTKTPENSASVWLQGQMKPRDNRKIDAIVGNAIPDFTVKLPSVSTNNQAPQTPQQSLDAALRFTELTAMLSGSVARCSKHEQQIITQCGLQIIDNWNQYTGMTAFTDIEIKKRLLAVWNDASKLAESYSKTNDFSCGDLLSKSKQASIWTVCTRDDQAPLSSDVNGLKIQ